MITTVRKQNTRDVENDMTIEVPKGKLAYLFIRRDFINGASVYQL